MHTLSYKKSSALVSAVAAALCITAPFCTALAAAPAQVRSVTYELDLPPQGLHSALQQVALTSNHKLFYRSELVSGKTSPAVKGNLTAQEAIQRLLSGTDLTFEITAGGVVLIKSKDDGKTGSALAGAGPIRMAQASSQKQPGNESSKASLATSDSASSLALSDEDAIHEVTVTGSRIVQDPGKLTRQMRTITRKELDASGISRLDEFLRHLPQSVNASTNVASGTFDSGINFGRGRNVYAGSGVNLRGLGEQYTLVLIDGRRPAKGGLFGDVADISAIPVEHVERIEILYDGAAALYGADAIGGVVNIITRRDFEGTTVTVDATETEDGGGEQLSVNVGHTFRWEQGGLTLNGGYQTRKPLDGAQREVRFAPLPAGGVGFASYDDDGSILYPSNPPNLGAGQAANPVMMYVRDVDGDGRTDNASLNERIPAGQVVSLFPNGGEIIEPTVPPPGYFPVYAMQLPQSIAGAQLSLYDIVENAGAPLPQSGASHAQMLAAMRARFPVGESTFTPGQGYSLLPTDDTLTASASFQHAFSDRSRLNLSARFSSVERDSSTRNNAHQMMVLGSYATNPFNTHTFVNFTDELPQTRQKVSGETRSVAGSIDFDLTPKWNVQLGFGFSENDAESRRRDALDRTALLNALNGMQYDINTGRYEYNGNAFYLPQLGFPDKQAYIDALIIPEVNTRTRSTSQDVDLNLSGVVMNLPAGEMRTNIIVSRIESSTHTYSEQFFDPLFTYEAREPDIRIDRKVRRGQTGAGAELSVPIFSSLLANANGRYERYDDVEEEAVNWSAGLNWTPLDWLVVRANRTYSVRIPEAILTGAETQLTDYNLYLRNEDRTYQPGFPSVPAYQIVGGNPGLEPERNYGTALGVIFRPLEGLDIELNITQSKIYGQIGVPGINTGYTPSELLPEAVARNPLLSFVENGRVVAGDQVFTGTTLTPFNPGGLPLVEGSYVLDRRDANVRDVLSRSADLAIRYAIDTSFGQWFINYSHQYMITQKVAAADICANDACMESPVGTRPLQVVGEIDLTDSDSAAFLGQRQPLPEHRGALDVIWSYRGLSASAQTTVQSTTSVLEVERHPALGADAFNVNRISTRAGASVNLGLGYDFSGDLFEVPAWLRKTRINLTVMNLFYTRTKVRRDVLVQNFVPDQFETTNSFSPYGVDPYGRSFALRIATTF